MFVRFFRSSFASQQVTIALTGLLMWGAAFFRNPVIPEPLGPVPLYSMLYNSLAGLPVIPVLLGWAVTLFTAFLLNYMLVKNEIVAKNSSLAGFLFVIFTSFHPSLLVLNPAGLSLLFLVMMLNSLFSYYNRPEALDLIYLAGFICGIGSMTYTPFAIFYLMVLVSLVLFRASNWREWAASLIGLTTPYLFLAAGYFWFDRFAEKLGDYSVAFRFMQKWNGLPEQLFPVLVILIILMTLIGWLSSMSRLSEKTIEIRKKTILLNWLPLVAIGSFFFNTTMPAFHVLILSGTGSMLLSIYLFTLKKSFWQELVMLLFILLVLINNLVLSR